MSPAHILEPTYQELKRRLTHGTWPAGFRLDTGRLAADLGVSKSPIRDSLNRLSGEQLVDFSPGDGFHVPWVDEQRLRDLLDFNLLLLIAAIGRQSAVQPVSDLAMQQDLDRAADRFLILGRIAQNSELMFAIVGLNDRLAAVRRLDESVLRQPTADLDELDAALSSGSGSGEIANILRRYHEHRGAAVPRYVALLRSGPQRSTERPLR